MLHNNKPIYVKKDWEEAKRYWNGECAYCGEKPKGNLTKDHCIAISRGGLKIKHNIIPSCGRCNQDKSSEPIEEWFRKQHFFSEPKLQKIYYWVAGGCYSLDLSKKK